MAVKPFLFKDIFKRIIDVGWGSGVYAIIVADVTSSDATMDSIPPIIPIPMVLTWRDMSPLNIDEAPKNPITSQPPNFDPVPPIVDPPSQEMLAFYKYWSLPPVIHDETSLTSSGSAATIEPDLAPGDVWSGPWYQFAHADEEAALAYIEEWRHLNPAWAGYGWWIWPPAPITVGSSFRSALYVSFFKLSDVPANDAGLARMTVNFPNVKQQGGGVNGSWFVQTGKLTPTDFQLLDSLDFELIDFAPDETRTLYDNFVVDVHKLEGTLTEVSKS